MSDMRVVAKTEDRYLISVNDDLEAVMKDALSPARVLRTRERKLGNPQSIHKFIGLPGWNECIMTPEETNDLLENYGVLAPAIK